MTNPATAARLFGLSLAAAAAGFAGPALAAGPDPVPTAAASAPAPSPAMDPASRVKPTTRVCVKSNKLTGTRIARTTCKTMAEWERSGVDPFAK